ncbi:cytochrome P450 [Mycolicibacterium litorale]|uniref:Cytochrome P450 138 n=1 Tax=Mycolicibacterium litorale TaxID=758802 RepID=A0AAD1MT86_9MYCO|nr:cytochrome P450 [Mycolicibacterium litorale]MCV7414748.1 cytochrome P450 [Mycolicibacterium litorale]BBY15913.1 putative cytochrome P450 138 [Mycolicibacterium litorale]
MGSATTEPDLLPPGPRAPKIVQGLAFLAARRPVMAALGKRFGGAFTLDLPVLGHTVMVSDPELVKDLFSTSRDLVGRARPNLGEILGPGSMFNLDGDELFERRRLLAPPFHGKRVGNYDRIIEDEVMREIAHWPEGREFETLESMMRITLNAILRAVFGAEGPALDELRRLLPPAVRLGARIGLLPEAVRRDYGPWSPGGRFREHRRRIDAVIESLIAEARADPGFADRTDVLALLLQARYEDGEPMSDAHIADELLTLLTAGHETTSTALAWAVERLRRYPALLSRLTAEVDAGGSELRQATIWEVLRTRPVLDGALRRTKTRIRLGDWVIPEGYTIMASVQLAHSAEASFPDAASFDPDRFVGAAPKPVTWIPFGGGINRCIGAAFANMEMDVTLRTLLRELRFVPTDAPGERASNRGVAFAPARGARAVVYRRTAGTFDAGDAAASRERAGHRVPSGGSKR